nr:keratin-associated protein 16-1-like [Microcebus murinus]
MGWAPARGGCCSRGRRGLQARPPARSRSWGSEPLQWGLCWVLCAQGQVLGRGLETRPWGWSCICWVPAGYAGARGGWCAGMRRPVRVSTSPAHADTGHPPQEAGPSPFLAPRPSRTLPRSCQGQDVECRRPLCGGLALPPHTGWARVLPRSLQAALCSHTLSGPVCPQSPWNMCSRRVCAPVCLCSWFVCVLQAWVCSSFVHGRQCACAPGMCVLWFVCVLQVCTCAPVCMCSRYVCVPGVGILQLFVLQVFIYPGVCSRCVFQLCMTQVCICSRCVCPRCSYTQVCVLQVFIYSGVCAPGVCVPAVYAPVVHILPLCVFQVFIYSGVCAPGVHILQLCVPQVFIYSGVCVPGVYVLQVCMYSKCGWENSRTFLQQVGQAALPGPSLLWPCGPCTSRPL